jgi:hypothetical protein
MSVGFCITFIGLLTRRYIEQTPRTELKMGPRLTNNFIIKLFKLRTNTLLHSIIVTYCLKRQYSKIFYLRFTNNFCWPEPACQQG